MLMSLSKTCKNLSKHVTGTLCMLEQDMQLPLLPPIQLLKFMPLSSLFRPPLPLLPLPWLLPTIP